MNKSLISSNKTEKVNGKMKRRNTDFEKNMKDLNKAFIASLRTAVKNCPSHSLVPMVKDYLYHSRVLMEQHKKGNPLEMLNGINMPPKSFKSLGEFFEDFEQTYVFKGENHGNSSDSPSHSSALNNSDSLSTLSSSDSSIKSNSNFSFNALSHYSSPKKFNAFGATSEPISRESSSPVYTETTKGSNYPPISFPSTSQPTQLNLSASPSKSIADTTAMSMKPSTMVPFSGFSFLNAPKPPSSTFGSSSTTAIGTKESNTDENNDDNADEDEPPKVEITQVKEDDSVYSIRCKIFAVVEGKCKDKGIGMLYVKKIEGEKYQIVVRADNNLGTVILNIRLQKSLPLEKNSKNSVMTVDLQGNAKKGTPIIIKVKTEDDATELFSKLKLLQQAS